MPKYHVNERGEAGMCRARKACPFGDLAKDHYASAEEARSAYEASMSSFGKTLAPNSLSPEALAKLSLDQRKLVIAAVGRVLKEEDWDERAKDYWQAVYDSTEAGALWLERKRLEGNKPGTSPDYIRRSAKLKELSESGEPALPAELPKDPEPDLQREFSSEEPLAFGSSKEMKDEKLKLALLSAAWMSSLTPEEVEAVSWLTSNGSSVVHRHLNGQPHPIWKDKYTPAHINRTIKRFRSAMAKAPELDEPVIIYRGTSGQFSEWESLDRPASSSLCGDTASSFAGKDEDGELGADEVLLEIKTKKLPVVVGMSAWGASELEVLAPLGKYRKVAEFDTLRGREGWRFGGRGEIDPDTDAIKVVQLEYVGTD